MSDQTPGDTTTAAERRAAFSWAYRHRELIVAFALLAGSIIGGWVTYSSMLVLASGRAAAHELMLAGPEGSPGQGLLSRVERLEAESARRTADQQAIMAKMDRIADSLASMREDVAALRAAGGGR